MCMTLAPMMFICRRYRTGKIAESTSGLMLLTRKSNQAHCHQSMIDREVDLKITRLRSLFMFSRVLIATHVLVFPP